MSKDEYIKKLVTWRLSGKISKEDLLYESSLDVKDDYNYFLDGFD